MYEWYDGEHYKVDISKLTGDEIRELLNFVEIIERDYGIHSWNYFNNVFVISDCIIGDIDLHIRFEHFLNEIEKRLDKEYWGFSDAIQKLDKIEEIEN